MGHNKTKLALSDPKENLKTTRFTNNPPPDPEKRVPRSSLASAEPKENLKIPANPLQIGTIFSEVPQSRRKGPPFPPPRRCTADIWHRAARFCATFPVRGRMARGIRRPDSRGTSADGDPCPSAAETRTGIDCRFYPSLPKRWSPGAFPRRPPERKPRQRSSAELTSAIPNRRPQCRRSESGGILRPSGALCSECCVLHAKREFRNNQRHLREGFPSPFGPPCKTGRF